MDNEENSEIAKLKKENELLRKELEDLKDSTKDPYEKFLNDNLDILIKPLEHFELSVRTLNCLKNENIKNLGDLIQISEIFLLRSNNFGRKSLAELQEILKKYNLNFNTPLKEWPPKNLGEKIKFLQEKAIQELEVDPDSLLDEIKSILNHREFLVLKQRFWENKTLQEIGLFLNITRERVRQYESKALRKIRIIKKNYLISFLKKNENKIFIKYSEDQNTIRQSTLQKILLREKLPRMRKLATDEEILIKITIKILYENIYKYFDKKYLTTDYGWKK